MNKTIGEIIKGRLDDMGKSQSWPAEEAKVSNNAVTKWIKSGQISRENAISVAKILLITLDDLVGSDTKFKADVYKEQLFYFYHGMSLKHKEALLQLANQLYSADHPDDRRSSPYPVVANERRKVRQ